VSGAGGRPLRIDPEFHALIAPLRPDERALLESSIRAQGVRDPLVVWQGVLIDGHNRHEIATRLGKPYQVVERTFESRDDTVASRKRTDEARLTLMR
jgi:hypothetical protein